MYIITKKKKKNSTSGNGPTPNKSEVPATGWRACTRTIAIDVGATIPKPPVIKGCRHSVPQQRGLITGASPFVQPPPTHVSLPLGEGVMEKVEDIWDLGRTTIKVSALWKCLQLYPLEDVALELGWGFSNGFQNSIRGTQVKNSPGSGCAVCSIHVSQRTRMVNSENIFDGDCF